MWGSYNRLGWYWPASCFSAKLASTSRLERKTDVLSTPSYIITVTSVVLDANKLCLEPDQEICPYLDSSTALSQNYIISFENESEKYFNNNLFIEKHEESYELRWWIFNHHSGLFPFFYCVDPVPYSEHWSRSITLNATLLFIQCSANLII